MTHDEMIAVLKAAQEGKKIQWLNADGEWKTTPNPKWNFRKYEYRVKPETPPDVTFDVKVVQETTYPAIRQPEHWENANVRFTFDGATGKLKSVELLGD